MPKRNKKLRSEENFGKFFEFIIATTGIDTLGVAMHIIVT
jgi:hypothetical protein